MNLPELRRTTIDEPGSIGAAQLNAMHPSRGRCVDTVFYTSEAPYQEHPFVYASTAVKGLEGNDTFIRVRPPFSKQEPGEGGNYPLGLARVAARPKGADLEVLARVQREQINPDTLRLCGAAVLLLSQPGGYNGLLDDGLTISSFGDARVEDSAPGEALWDARMSQEPASIARFAESHLPNEYFLARRSSGDSLAIHLSIEDDGQTLLSANDVSAENSRLSAMALRIGDYPKIRMDRNDRDGISLAVDFATAAAALAFRLSDSLEGQ